jgi:hypothetical protein
MSNSEHLEYADADTPAEPPAGGKPASMPGEQFAEQCRRLVAVRDALDDAAIVASHSLCQNEAGDVSGAVRVLTTGRLAEMNHIFDEFSLVASALTLGHETIDSEQMLTLGVVVMEG